MKRKLVKRMTFKRGNAEYYIQGERFLHPDFVVRVLDRALSETDAQKHSHMESRDIKVEDVYER